MSMNDLITSWENATESLERTDDEVNEVSAEETAESAENLFEAARW